MSRKLLGKEQIIIKVTLTKVLLNTRNSQYGDIIRVFNLKFQFPITPLNVELTHLQ